MLLLVCYRMDIGENTVHGDEYEEVARFDPENLENIRTKIRDTVVHKYNNHLRILNAKFPGTVNATSKPGRLHFTCIIRLEDGKIPEKEKAGAEKAPQLSEDGKPKTSQKAPAPSAPGPKKGPPGPPKTPPKGKEPDISM